MNTSLPSFVKTAPDVKVSALFKAKTPWNVWLHVTGYAGVGWPGLIALLIRNVDIRDVIMPFVLALEEAAQSVEAECVKRYDSVQTDEPIDFFDWLALWKHHPEQAVLDRAMSGLAQRHSGDASFGLKALAQGSGDARGTLWFLTGATADWLAQAELAFSASLPGNHAWIAAIAGRTPENAIAQIYASLYQAFVERSGLPVAPLDANVAAYLSTTVGDLHTDKTGRNAKQRNPSPNSKDDADRLQSEEAALAAFELLGEGPEWPHAAAKIVVTRKAVRASQYGVVPRGANELLQ